MPCGVGRAPRRWNRWGVRVWRRLSSRAWTFTAHLINNKFIYHLPMYELCACHYRGPTWHASQCMYHNEPLLRTGSVRARARPFHHHTVCLFVLAFALACSHGRDTQLHNLMISALAAVRPAAYARPIKLARRAAREGCLSSGVTQVAHVLTRTQACTHGLVDLFPLNLSQTYAL